MSATAFVVGTLACSASSSDTRVARAHTFEFTADDAVQLIGPQPELPADPAVVQTVADLWIEYTLLAWALQEDSTFQHLDLDPIIDQQVEQELILELRDQVVQPDTVITEEQLRAYFDDAAPAQARARHILLGFPSQATEAQRDSVRAAIQQLRARVVAGESFEALARQFSQDRGSGQQGGDMGYFERGQMVRPFDEAVFALEVGEISDVVETPYGYHIIELQDLVYPSFEEARVGFRERILSDRTFEAESVYVSGVFDRAASEVQDGAAEIVREVARDPRANLSRRALNRVLVEYEGGRITVADLRAVMQTRDSNFRLQVINATDEVIETQVLDELLQRKLLVREAREAGLGRTEEQRDSLADLVRGRFRGSAGSLGLMDALRGTDDPAAVEAAVDDLMRRIVSGETNVIPLGPIALTLRREYRSELFEAGIVATVTRLNEIRGPAPATPAPLPTQAPDTLGN